MSPAREMLEFSRDSIDQIADSVGYQDVRGFRRTFQAIVGLTPSEYRRCFSAARNPAAVEAATFCEYLETHRQAAETIL